MWAQLQGVIVQQSQAIKTQTKRFEEIEVKSVMEVRLSRDEPAEQKLSHRSNVQSAISIPTNGEHVYDKEVLLSNVLPSGSTQSSRPAQLVSTAVDEAQPVTTRGTTTIEKSRKAVKMADPFSGDADVLAYLTQFASCAKHNC